MTIRIASYELEHRLGEGGQGTVWRARAAAPAAGGARVAVAVKRVRGRDASLEPPRLDHPNIVRILDVVPDCDAGATAIVMELAVGGSLHERLVRSGPLPPREAVRVCLEVAGALTFAHGRGVLHLDVKPGNVLFDADGHALLGDFATGSAGTPGFAAPEVVAGDTVDARADVYGIGRLLASIIDGVPAGLGVIIAKATATDPAGRYASMSELADALHAADLDGPASASGASLARAEPATRAFGPRPPHVDRALARRRVPRPLGTGVVVAVLALLVVVLVAGARRDPAASQARAAAGPDRTSRHCPPAAVPAVPAGSDLLEADLDGDGCADPVVRTGHVLERNGIRFALGQPGDRALLGDWDCDGIATPAVWRPSSAEAYVFDRWAGDGERLPATEVVTAATAPAARCPAAARP